MPIDWVRKHCLSFPGATENIQWGSDLVFKVSGKMFVVMNLEPSDHILSFKCSDDDFAELTERPGIIPAPYLARAKWVTIQDAAALPTGELKRKLRESYDLVAAKLPKSKRPG